MDMIFSVHVNNGRVSIVGNCILFCFCFYRQFSCELIAHPKGAQSWYFGHVQNYLPIEGNPEIAV